MRGRSAGNGGQHPCRVRHSGCVAESGLAAHIPPAQGVGVIPAGFATNAKEYGANQRELLRRTILNPR